MRWERGGGATWVGGREGEAPRGWEGREGEAPHATLRHLRNSGQRSGFWIPDCRSSALSH